jgi:hypothetical protein
LLPGTSKSPPHALIFFFNSLHSASF